MNRRDIAKLLNKLDELELFLNDKVASTKSGNPYHDALGKFTWSPFGKYDGDYTTAKAVSTKDYKQIVDSYDVGQLTDEEYNLVLRYCYDSDIGNSFEKNSAWDKKRDGEVTPRGVYRGLDIDSLDKPDAFLSLEKYYQTYKDDKSDFLVRRYEEIQEKLKNGEELDSYEKEGLNTVYPNLKKYLAKPVDGSNADYPITAQEFSTYSDKVLDKIIEKYPDGSAIKRTAVQEKEGRKLDKVIEEKGVALDRDIVVTRRVRDVAGYKYNIEQNGFFTNYGFTSTTASTTIAKKAPGEIVFGDNILKIVIPKGTKVFPIESILDSEMKRGKIDTDSVLTMKTHNGLKKQHEFLLPSSTKFITVDGSRNFEKLNSETASKLDKSTKADKQYQKDDVYALVAITPEYQKRR